MNFIDHPDYAAAVRLCERLADTARGIARQHFRASLEVEKKADGSPVTVADRGIEDEWRRMIRREFPAHAIRGEEFGAEGEGEFTWFLDPIDGTKSFVSGFPLFGSLIALRYAGRPVLGVIEAPALEERWFGSDGAPSTLNGRVIRTSACRRLAEATVYSTSAELFDPGDRRRFEAVSAGAALRRFGGDCYQYGMLAAGYCDLVIESRLKPHDFLALIPVIEGAGGRISDWQGAALGPGSDGRVIAAATEELWREACQGLCA